MVQSQARQTLSQNTHHKTGLVNGSSGRVPAQQGRRNSRGARRGMNMVQILCTCVCKCKNDACQICSRNGREWVKGSSGRGEFKYNIFDTL
jgi:hypothetical protein